LTNKQTDKQNKNQIRPPSSQPISSPSVSLRSPEIFFFPFIKARKTKLETAQGKKKKNNTYLQPPPTPPPPRATLFFWSKIAISPLPCSPIFLCLPLKHSTKRTGIAKTRATTHRNPKSIARCCKNARRQERLLLLLLLLLPDAATNASGFPEGKITTKIYYFTTPPSPLR
jgi:hypothetical protein